MGKFQKTPQILLHLILIFSATFILSQSIQAKCAPTPSIDKEFNRADAVFVGTVSKKADFTVAVNKFKYSGSVFSFSVEEAFKGDIQKTIDIKSLALTAESYFNFKEGEKYLVYAVKNSKSGELTATRCTRTKLYSVADEDIIGIRLISYLNNKEWMRISPAISTRSDVENILGKCESGQSMICSYETDSGNLIVSYNSRNSCNGETPEISRQKVLSLTFILKNDIILENLPLDLKQFIQEDDAQSPGLQYFNYKEKTLILNSIKYFEKEGKFIYAFRFLPSEPQMKFLKCDGK